MHETPAQSAPSAGHDRSLLEWFATLTPEQRLTELESRVGFFLSLRRTMNPSFREILELLNKHEVEYIVVGGVAAVIQGAPITTFDLDALVRISDDNASGTVVVRWTSFRGLPIENLKLVFENGAMTDM